MEKVRQLGLVHLTRIAVFNFFFFYKREVWSILHLDKLWRGISLSGKRLGEKQSQIETTKSTEYAKAFNALTNQLINISYLSKGYF